jgi:acyl dehydratase
LRRRGRAEYNAFLMALPVNRDVVGKEYPPYPVTVERGKIKEFARALGDPNPFYTNDDVGRASPWGDLIAPPTFLITFRDDTDGSALLRDLGVDISRVLHGEQEFELKRPIMPGRTYLCRAKVIDVYEKTGRSGPLAFVVRETTVTDGENEIVAIMRQTTAIRL